MRSLRHGTLAFSCIAAIYLKQPPPSSANNAHATKARPLRRALSPFIHGTHYL